MTNGNGITKTAAVVEGLWNIRIPKTEQVKAKEF